MSEVINACVLLIGCRVADVRLIINSLTNDVQTRFIIEDVTKLSEGLERICQRWGSSRHSGHRDAQCSWCHGY